MGYHSGKHNFIWRLCKKSTKYGRENRLGIHIPTCFYTINHEGSSSLMEAKLALKLTKQLFDKKRSCLHQASFEWWWFNNKISVATSGQSLQGFASYKYPWTSVSNESFAYNEFILEVTKTKNPNEYKIINILYKYFWCFIYKNRYLPIKEFVKNTHTHI